MRLPINIDDVLHGQTVEWERLELKQGWNPEAVLHTMCAFANEFSQSGRRLHFHRRRGESGQPVLPPSGLPANKLDRIQKGDSRNWGTGCSLTTIQFVAPLCRSAKARSIVLWCPGRPISALQGSSVIGQGGTASSHTYVRKGSVFVRARHQEEVELVSLAAHRSFRRPHPPQHLPERTSIFRMIQSFLREVGSDLLAESGKMEFAQLCRQMRIADGPAEAEWHPLNVGLSLQPAPQKFFPQTQIDVVQFPKGRAMTVSRRRPSPVPWT